MQHPSLLPLLAKRTKTSSPSSSSPKQADPTKISPPEIKFDHRKGNTILHQKAARAAELHAELNTLLESQAQRRAEEANRPFGAGFVDFIKKSKSELINILAAFTCVMLAYQIVNVRKGARRLIAQAEETNGTMEEYKQILRILSSDEFVKGVNDQHLKDMKMDENMRETNRFGRIGVLFGRGRVSNNTSPNVDEVGTAMEEKDIMIKALKSELYKVIGDRALTSMELEEKKLMQLQKEMGLVQEAKKKRDMKNQAQFNNSTDDSLGGLEQIFIELQSEDGSNSPKTITKRTQGFI
jgi:hypothetical protein